MVPNVLIKNKNPNICGTGGHRVQLCRFGVSNHNLPIEKTVIIMLPKGRSTFYAMQQFRDENQYLFICSFFNRERKLYLPQERRRWPNIKTTLGQQFILLGTIYFMTICFDHSRWHGAPGDLTFFLSLSFFLSFFSTGILYSGTIQIYVNIPAIVMYHPMMCGNLSV